MEKESFEDEEAAGYLNDTFICIKVDREERPDIDAVYMAACQMLTGSGGWPFSIFMTPEKKPFFAATYLPKNSRSGRAGLIDICRQVKNCGSTTMKRSKPRPAALPAAFTRAFAFTAADEPDASLLETAFNQIKSGIRPGSSAALSRPPKFPTPHRLLFLLRCYHRTGDARALDMVSKNANGHASGRHLGSCRLSVFTVIPPIADGFCRILKKCSMIRP